MTRTTLVSSAGQHSRNCDQVGTRSRPCSPEYAAKQSIVLILQGLSDGKFYSGILPGTDIKCIATGCFFCIGSLTLRVALNHILRKPPARLYISIADSTHFSSAPHDNPAPTHSLTPVHCIANRRTHPAAAAQHFVSPQRNFRRI